jgi:hypothetical protein
MTFTEDEPTTKQFTKSRVLMMKQALYELQPVIKGNHLIELIDGTFKFYYRDTLLMEYSLNTGLRNKVNAGKFEGLPSTRAQRKAIYEAIVDFEQWLAEKEPE